MSEAIANKGKTLNLATLRAQVEEVHQQTTAELGNKLQVLFATDLTGSMWKYHMLIAEKINEIAVKIKHYQNQSSFAFCGYRNHGDEERYGKIFTLYNFTTDTKKLEVNVAGLKKGGGGEDSLTCIEDVLHIANSKLAWIPEADKSVILIGDMPPHGVIDNIGTCPHEIDYRTEVTIFKANKIKLHTVYCGIKDREKVRNSFRWMAEMTGGVSLEIEDIDSIVDIFAALSLSSSASLPKFVAEHPQLQSQVKAKLLAISAGKAE